MEKKNAGFPDLGPAFFVGLRILNFGRAETSAFQR
jgi:hypothetical protein